MSLKDIATAAAKGLATGAARDAAALAANTVASKASDVIDSNREQLVAEFERAVARQRELLTRDATIIVSRLTRAGLAAAAVVALSLIALAFSLFSHH